MAIWNTDTEDVIKTIRVRSDFKNARFKGRKPDKMILPREDVSKVKLKELKQHIAYNGLILGIGEIKPIYDGRINGLRPSMIITDDLKDK